MKNVTVQQSLDVAETKGSRLANHNPKRKKKIQ